jgi:hypothetical protein
LLLLAPSLALAALEKVPAPSPAPASGAKKLSLVFTGDNGGEIAPCG